MENYDWPGWSLKDNPFGKDFDLNARKRMVSDSRLLLPFIQKQQKNLGKSILEVGPFFDPLITANKYTSKQIYYIDNDPFVLTYWKKKNYKNLHLVPDNLNSICEKNGNGLKFNNKFDSIIISQVFNYIDYATFLKISNRWLKTGGLIFINNVINHGIPKLFSKYRPKNNTVIIKTLKQLKYRLLTIQQMESKNKRTQKENRLLLVAQKV